MQKPMNFGGWGGGPPRQMPQGQQGGMPQPPMGGGAPPPRPGPAQLGAGGGQPPGGIAGLPQWMQDQENPEMWLNAPDHVRMAANSMYNQNHDQSGRYIGGGGGAAGYQSQIDALQRQLMMAQINGAPPQVIGNLQLQLQQAQRAMQQAGIRAMGSRDIGRPGLGAPGVGTNGRGGSYSASARERQRRYDAESQMLAALWGMGGGGRGIGG